MTLPASGAISMADIAVELGYSNTTVISLSNNEVITLAGVGSTVVLPNSFWGKSYTDYVLDPIDFEGGGVFTVSGINQTVTLRFTIQEIDGSGGYSVYSIGVNSSRLGMINLYYGNAANTTTMTVMNGDTFYFYSQITAVSGESANMTSEITVYNQSTGNNTLGIATTYAAHNNSNN